ncbi:MAG: hypothetical protein HY393_01115 [Candidatus Diapherotrites archaeon]|nr:hypothetical protein [Candidatus Diapherotrites archaeon]
MHHHRTAQGSLEYLLLIGGIVLISSVVLFVILSSLSPLKSSVNTSIEDYQNALDTAGSFEGGGSNPPVILLDAYQGLSGGEIGLVFSTDALVDAHIIGIETALAPNPDLIDPDNFESTFSTLQLDYNDVQNGLVPGGHSYQVLLSMENTEYSFFVLACNVGGCSVAYDSAFSGVSAPPLPGISLTAFQGASPASVDLLFTNDIALDLAKVMGMQSSNAPIIVNETDFDTAFNSSSFIEYQFSIPGPLPPSQPPGYSYAATGLAQPSTLYTFFAKGCNSTGCTLASAQAFSGMQAPDTTPPAITLFSLDWDDSKVFVSFDAVEPGNESPPVIVTAIRGTSQALVDSVGVTGPSNSFDNPPAGVIAISLGSPPGTYKDSGLGNNVTYYYRLRACDSGVSTPNCVTNGNSLSVTPHIPAYTFQFGPEETVLKWASGAANGFCSPTDLPDNHVRAFKTNTGLVLFASNASKKDSACNPSLASCDFKYYIRRGTNFNNIQSECTSYFVSGKETLPDNFNNLEWFWSGYYKDDKLHTIVYNEYHDPNNPGSCGGSTSIEPGNVCRYTGFTYAVSADDGKTFAQPAYPSNMVAGPPLQWDAPAMNSPQGYGHYDITNIISKQEGTETYYYALVHFADISGSPAYSKCLIRTNNLGDPASWRAWDGSGFTISMPSPYPSPYTTKCASVSTSQLGPLMGTITYNSVFNKYLLVGYMANWDASFFPAEVKCGFFYSTSDNLINWSQAKHFLEYQGSAQAFQPAGQNPCNTSAKIISYGAAIDHEQLNDPNDPNFEKSGKDFYIYFTYWPDFYNQGWIRDLVRRKVTVIKS